MGGCFQEPREWQQGTAETKNYTLDARTWSSTKFTGTCVPTDANEFLEKSGQCAAILATKIDVADSLLHLTAAMLNGDEFHLTLPAGASVKDATPELIKAGVCHEGMILKLVMPNGNVLKADDFLPAATAY